MPLGGNVKKLYYRRHSIKDGAVKDTIGPKGLALACLEGQRFDKLTADNLDKVFHGPLVRTAQTAFAFCNQLHPPQLMPAIEEIGNQKWFDDLLDNGKYMETANTGKTHLAALYAAARDNKELRVWIETAERAVEKMFDQMNEGETAIAFGHTPIIELAAENLVTFGTPLPDGWDHLAELDGLVFDQDRLPGVSGIEVREIIRAHRVEPSKA